MEKNSLAYEIENKTPGSLIAKYSLPAIMSGVVASLYNIVDQVFIGNIVGTVGIAATNVAYPLVTLTLAMMLMCGLGSSINLSIALGRKEIPEAKRFIGTALMVTPLVGIVISVITLLFSKELLLLFGATEENLQLAYTYINITAFGYPFWMTTESATKLIRVDGSPRYAMVCTVTGAILNCGLNPLLMIGFGMGMAGAAYATVIGQLISFALAMSYFFRFRMFKLKLKEILPNWYSIKRMMTMGVSPAMNQTVMMITQIITNNIMGIYGAQSIYGAEIPLACVGIITKVNAIYMAVMVGIAQGAQPLLGYSYGAKKPDKVMQIFFQCIKYASIVSVLVFFSFQVFPRQILSIFGAEGELYFEFGVSYFRIFMLMTFLNGIQPVTFNFFSALGKPLTSSIVSLSKQLIFLIPLIIVLPSLFGIGGVLYAGPIADSMAFLLTFFFLRREIKRLKASALKPA